LILTKLWSERKQNSCTNV